MRCGTGGSAPGHKIPITGIAVCCARAASGHPAAPPSRLTNSIRLMLGMVAPSQVPPPIIPARDPPGAGGLTHKEPAGGRVTRSLGQT